MPSTPLIAYSHVAKTFDGGRVLAVDDVSLDVAEGEFLAIVGGSGSGKTTLLRLANRLIEADRGSIRVEGEDVSAADPILPAPAHRLCLPERRAVSAYQRRRQYRHHAAVFGLAGGRDCRRVDELLDLVQLDRAAYRDRMPHELSGGQRQRVGVARALAAKPRIVLMDEPFGALDPLTRDALGDDYRALHRKLGLTTVMITHDMTEAILLADRIAVMRGGKLLAQGTPAELSRQQRYLCRRTPAHAAAAGGAAERGAAAGWRGMSLFTDPRWGEALTHLPDYLGNHVRVSVTALALGLAVSLPLAILARNRPVLRGALLGVASIVQTVPGLALLALFYPLLLALAALSLSWFGFGFSAFGFLPAVLALALYSMLPVLRNTITGLQGVDPALLEAAQGVGMTPKQSLFTVELPLALPVMMAGIRTAAVWVIGTATLSTPIGQTSLGNYIFAGLQTQNWVFVLFGCLAAAVLALAVDQLLALIENGLRNRKPAAHGAGRHRHRRAGPATLVPTLARSSATYIVGAKTFAEQYVLSALMAQRLRAAGLSASSARRARLQCRVRCAGGR